MDERTREVLEAAGVRTDEALERFLGSEALLMKFLLRFPSDQNFARLEEALAAGDPAGAFAAAHTLKGVAGNLSLADLFQALEPVVEALRRGDLAAARGAMPDLTARYGRLTAALTGLA